MIVSSANISEECSGICTEICLVAAAVYKCKDASISSRFSVACNFCQLLRELLTVHLM